MPLNVSPIVVADDQGSASPDANPQMHVNPYEAAKEIRHTARSIADHVENFVPSNGGVARQRAELIHTTNNRARDLTSRSSDRLGLVIANLADLERGGNLYQAVEVEIRARRTKPAMEAFEVYAEFVREQRGLSLQTQERLEQARNDLNSVHNESYYLKSEVGQAATPNATEIRKLCDRLHVLAQSLPTFPNAPMAPADNVLRAMATLLKNGGYLDSSSEYVKVIQGNDQNIEGDGDDDYDDYDEEA